ncbi:MAG: bifunctional lysine ketoglutarate reductase /saccharopine dehydrogenase family protein [Bacteroidales bacterium]
MNKIVGIRYEDKYEMERRVPIVPHHVKKLVAKGLEFHVQTSAKRAFTDDSFEDAGAKVVASLERADVIFGVKEMPVSFFEENKTYIYFSHVVKGQPYNMPMLRAMMEKKCQLIDYEKIENEENKRLIFFGRFAGLAGMINSLWSLGQRYKEQGIETPFAHIRQAYTYPSLKQACEAVSKAGYEIARNGLPDAISPVVIAFTGYGNVSKGAQEIAQLLPSIEVTPQQLLELNPETTPRNLIYKVVFKESDLSCPKDNTEVFDLHEYYSNPELYQNCFETYVPHITVLVNCIYWNNRYPRMITKDFLEKLYSHGEPKIKVIGDISCDPDGSIECTHKGTEIENPVFVYNPFTRQPTYGFEGQGILVMAVDILPSELPLESSIGFSEALYPYVEQIVKANYSGSFDEVNLPLAIKKAMVLHKGEFTPNYTYMKAFV